MDYFGANISFMIIDLTQVMQKQMLNDDKQT